MRTVWYHQIWIQTYLIFIVSDLVYISLLFCNYLKNWTYYYYPVWTWYVISYNQMWLDWNYILLFSTQICISGITLMSTEFGIPVAKWVELNFEWAFFEFLLFKGQLISEAIFLGFKSPKKQMSFWRISALASKMSEIKKKSRHML